MDDPSDELELERRFAESAVTSLPRAPLYAALSAGIAADPGLHRLLLDAPPTQRLPVLLFASIHSLLIAEPTHPLADWYPNLRSVPRLPDDDELMPTLSAFVRGHLNEIKQLVSTRSTQTNEVGRSLLFLPPLGMIAQEVGPVTMIDVGASGGLNLLLDQFGYRYEPDDGSPASTVGLDSTVTLTASTRGAVPIPAILPTIAGRLGIDASPIDVTNDGRARWLEACVWPDQPERFRRLRAAIDLARIDPPRILNGDLVAEISEAVERVRPLGHPVVTNSWVLNYLHDRDRGAFMDELEHIGAAGDLSWIAAEAPALTTGLPWPDEIAENWQTQLLLTTWRDGIRTVRHLAQCHPHGFWMHWQ